MRRGSAGRDAFDPGDVGDEFAIRIGGHGDLIVLRGARSVAWRAAQALHEGGHVLGACLDFGLGEAGLQIYRMRSINRALFIDADEEHGLGYEVGSTMFQGSSAS
jgi:hypothetical protein